MELRNNRWYDENNNSWNANVETEKSAKEKSETLLDCIDCHDCSNCIDCHDCSYCHDCQSCSYCSNCSDCHDCQSCSYCHDCHGCSYCHDWDGWNPAILWDKAPLWKVPRGFDWTPYEKEPMRICKECGSVGIGTPQPKRIEPLLYDRTDSVKEQNTRKKINELIEAINQMREQ